MRKYEEIWTRLKAPRKTHSLRIEVSGFNTAYLKRDIKTLVRGVQKEKYNDFDFQRKHLNSTLTHEVEGLADVPTESQLSMTSVFVKLTLTVIPSAEEFE